MRNAKVYACIATGLLTSGPAFAAAPGPNAPKQRMESKPAVVTEVPIPKSIFVVPSSPNEGRNPFFPEALETKPSTTLPDSTGIDPNAIVVNGITSPPRATVMLNGKTFEVGEAGDVKLKDGVRIPVQCLEIKTNSVILLVSGQRRELKFKAGI